MVSFPGLNIFTVMEFEESDVYQAIVDGDLAALGCYMQNQDMNMRDKQGRSFLHLAIEFRRQDVIDILAPKVFLGFRDFNGDTVLDLAHRYGMLHVEEVLLQRVRTLIETGDSALVHVLLWAGWQAWPQARSTCASSVNLQHITDVCNQIQSIHLAIYRRDLPALQEMLTEESLVLACDQTGLPPLQKAVLFEWLSLAEFLCLGFPQAVNHPDHMNRTALHYAAGYGECQDKILYTVLLKAGAKEDSVDLAGYTPKHYIENPGIFSIENLRDEVLKRLLRKQHSPSFQSYESNEAAQSVFFTSISNINHSQSRRWQTVVSVMSFASNIKDRISKHFHFEETSLYESIITNDTAAVRTLLEAGECASCRNLEGWNYIHLAVAHYVSPHIIGMLLGYINPAEKDVDGLNPFELALANHKHSAHSNIFMNLILKLFMKNDIIALQKLAQDGWQYWPSTDYAAQFLVPMGASNILPLLCQLVEFKEEILELHQAAILHEAVMDDFPHLLASETGVASLDIAGLSLVHICVIFYNIKLLAFIIQKFPAVVNTTDCVRRTPLHYAAGLCDNNYAYNILHGAGAKDDEEDLWGMRPVDYQTQKTRIISVNIQETIKNKLYSPLKYTLTWPRCLLSAKMECTNLFEAIRNNNLDTVKSLLADAKTQTSLRDSEGCTFLHHAVLSRVDVQIFHAVLTHVDFAVRDKNCQNVLDLLQARGHLCNEIAAIEAKVKELFLGETVQKKNIQHLKLSGWDHWPVAIEEAKAKSEEAAKLLEEVLQHQENMDRMNSAMLEGRLADVRELMGNKQLPTGADCTGLPALHKAVLFDQQELIQYMLTNHRESLNIKDNMERTALHFAASCKDSGKLYNILKDAGADEGLTDLVGQTPKEILGEPTILKLEDIKKRALDTLKTRMSKAKTGVVLAKMEPAVKPGLLFHEAMMGKTLAQTEEATRSKKFPETAKPSEVDLHLVPRTMPKSQREKVPPPTTADGKYLAEHLGLALTLGLTDIAEKRPHDPVEYLGLWLRKYRSHLADPYKLDASSDISEPTGE